MKRGAVVGEGRLRCGRLHVVVLVGILGAHLDELGNGGMMLRMEVMRE